MWHLPKVCQQIDRPSGQSVNPGFSHLPWHANSVPHPCYPSRIPWSHSWVSRQSSGWKPAALTILPMILSDYRNECRSCHRYLRHWQRKMKRRRRFVIYLLTRIEGVEAVLHQIPNNTRNVGCFNALPYLMVCVRGLPKQPLRNWGSQVKKSNIEHNW